MTTIQARPGSPYARLYSVGSAIPSRVVDNEEMCTYIDSSDEWIQQRTGITERRWIAEGEDAQSLAKKAAESAIERSGLSLDQIDAVIVSTVSQYKQTPAMAPLLAADLGLQDAAAFDIGAACAGFCYGVAQADALVRSGAATHVLVVGVETLSKITDLHDRSTAFLFADGAGAAVVGPSEVNGIGPVEWGSDGYQAEVIDMTADWLTAVEQGVPSYVKMNGQAVFRWATGYIADAAKRTLEAAGITPDQLDCFIPHQANNRITDSMLRHLKLPEKVVVARTIKQLGNTSAASVPIAMDELLSSGQAKSGDTALIIGFGAGLVYAGQVVVLP
ncbi:beta-ketoacyl-ACP synthase III [Nigerium massiliense]|uniref:beta-ketoacyl-ACP synthase III n=1 Tax=Nigerium massiliense TaxID=1522317 RepID=UPI00058FCD46|nr:beta-ketoacyl-ACP synthase III [Nigerium massiliense]